ncbi:MAG: STELLO glycosyltransferase family protein [Desulfatirhabdiaceae bacterium]
MTRTIVITSIFPPTPAVHRWRDSGIGNLVVVGDQKTPVPWSLEKTIFISAETQKTLPFHIIPKLPWNHYARKMIGYLTAMSQEADVIIDTDDDNFPTAGHNVLDRIGTYPVSPKNRGFVNVYRQFTDQFIWPRGFPLNRIRSECTVVPQTEWQDQTVTAAIWQGLVNGEPDVDAIYRLTSNLPCTFNPGSPVVLDSGTICPFNSQNTVFFRDVFALMYLPAFVSFRFTDILRGLVAQPILWQSGLRLGFTGPTAFQDRNPHDYLSDFVSEIPCYLNAETVIDVTESVVRPDASISDNLFQTYDALFGQGIVPDSELILLDAWLKDVAKFRFR